jgi:tRNA-Thr(GGU) m(6)t(6)A37 methyltransferase TsaA
MEASNKPLSSEAPHAMQYLRPIGTIRSPFKKTEGMPIQPVFAVGTEGTVEILPQFAEGLQDLDGFERLWLMYWLHQAPPGPLRVIPFRDTRERGVFATRAPCRPNPIGLSCVRLVSIAKNVLTISGVDILNGTPLLDIKPYVAQFDAFPNSRAGWLDQMSASSRAQADARFAL